MDWCNYIRFLICVSRAAVTGIVPGVENRSPEELVNEVDERLRKMKAMEKDGKIR